MQTCVSTTQSGQETYCFGLEELAADIGPRLGIFADTVKKHFQ